MADLDVVSFAYVLIVTRIILFIISRQIAKINNNDSEPFKVYLAFLHVADILKAGIDLLLLFINDIVKSLNATSLNQPIKV